MTWTYTDEYYKNYTRDTWNESAPAYDPVLRNLDKFNGDLLKRAAPRPGERVLDVATGPGQPALTIAPLVGPQGRVVGIDLAERMVELANRRAKEARLDNVEFRTMDAESLDFPDASFDLVVCRFGLQIVTDPDRALAEMRRVLKPGGRLVVTVWGPGERVPAIHVIIGPMLENAEPDENGYIPTPYEMGGPGELVEVLRKAGFRDAGDERVTREWTFRDEEEFFAGALKGTPIGHSLSEEEPDVQKEVLRKTRENLQRWKTPAGLALPAECVVAWARK
jgi:ubiquinone/menaquinone biosynthesis C-methylase UbiE